MLKMSCLYKHWIFSHALRWTALYNRIRMARLLIEQAENLELDAQSNNKRTPLHQAVEKKNKEIVILLLEAGARIDVHDDKKQTPLNLAQEMKEAELINLINAFRKNNASEAASN